MTDTFLESIAVLIESNFKNLIHLSLVDCQINFKRSKVLSIILSGNIKRLTQLNLNRNPLGEKGVI